jgi:hypothetical protein
VPSGVEQSREKTSGRGIGFGCKEAINCVVILAGKGFREFVVVPYERDGEAI